MKKLTIVKLVFLVVMIPFLYVEYHFWSNDYSEKPVPIAHGKIERKFETSYSCGDNGKDRCTASYFVINKVKHKVDKDSYMKNLVGENVYLTKMQVTTDKWYDYHVMFIMGYIMLGVLSFVIWFANL